MEEILVNELKKRWLTTKEIRRLTGWSLVRITQWIFSATIKYQLAERQPIANRMAEFKIIQEEDYAAV
jgi:hypothetical protein